MRRTIPFFLALYLPFFAFRCLAQDDPATVAKAQDRAYATVQAHLNWTKQTSHGATIRAEESSRHPDAIQYRMFVSGLPTDTSYTAVSWPVNGTPTQVMQGITIGKDGVFTCAGRTPEECGDAAKPDDAIDFTFYPQKGEPYRMLFVSEHGPQSRVAIVLVPDPIKATDKVCSLTAVRLSPKFELSYITGSGFGPNAQVSFDTQSWNEKHMIPGLADADGDVQLTMLNRVVGHDRGITRQSVGCRLQPFSRFEWGPVNLPAREALSNKRSRTRRAGCGSAPAPPVDLQWLKAQQTALAAQDPVFVADIAGYSNCRGSVKPSSAVLSHSREATMCYQCLLSAACKGPISSPACSTQRWPHKCQAMRWLIYTRWSARGISIEKKWKPCLHLTNRLEGKKNLNYDAAAYSDLLQAIGHEVHAKYCDSPNRRRSPKRIGAGQAGLASFPAIPRAVPPCRLEASRAGIEEGKRTTKNKQGRKALHPLRGSPQRMRHPEIQKLPQIKYVR